MLGRPCLLLLSLLVLFLAGCDSQSAGPPAIGEAYAGPATLSLRKELGPQSATTATVKHGDRLEILATRRRFIKVRTAQGVEGWTDERFLLTPEQMEGLHHIARAAAELPSQGVATIDEPLNMHTEPNRMAPSFYQIPENAKLEVVAHRAAPRVQNPPEAAFLVAKIKPPAPPQRKPRSSAKRPPLAPLPSPPGPPKDWLTLSLSVAQPAIVEPPQPKPEKPAPPPRMDDWNLVRTNDGKAGWVLSRMLLMAIPDEVAQYAEGHRITSYFSLRDVHDGDRIKHDWLWTTMTHSGEPYEFDRLRVFIWSLHHHRYETVYREKDLKGYYPVEVSTWTSQNGKRTASAPAFSIVAEDDDRKLYRTTYVFSGNRVQLVGRTPYERPKEMGELRPKDSSAPAGSSPAPPHVSWFARMRQSLTAWRHWRSK